MAKSSSVSWNSLVTMFVICAMWCGTFVVLVLVFVSSRETGTNRGDLRMQGIRQRETSRVDLRMQGIPAISALPVNQSVKANTTELPKRQSLASEALKRFTRTAVRKPAFNWERELQRIAGPDNATKVLHGISTELIHSFDSDPVISIRGFYSSGTNWLRALIRTNCPALAFERNRTVPLVPNTTVAIDVDGVYGWKHGYFLDYEKSRFRLNQKHSIIIISREAPTWVLSAKKMNAMVRTRSSSLVSTRFGVFNLGKTPPRMLLNNSQGSPNKLQIIQKPLVPLKKPDENREENLLVYIGRHTINHSAVFFWSGKAYYSDTSSIDYNIVTNHTLGARSLVYKQWMSLLNDTDISSRIHFVRYEDLYIEPQRRFSELITKTNVPCQVPSGDAFDSVSGRVKYGAQNNNTVVKSRHHRYELCSKVSKEQTYQNILSQLDLEFEHDVLGYSYPATLSEYCAPTVS